MGVDTRAITACIERLSAPGPPRLEVLGSSPAGRFGMIPGSFDPMTNGHAALADAVPADAVVLVWSPATLPKDPSGSPEPSLLPPVTRIESLIAYAEAHPRVHVAICSHGLYVDQADACARRFPGARPVIALGSDKVIQLLDHRWYDDRDPALTRLFGIADVAYALRSTDEERLEAALVAEPRWSDRLERLTLAPDVASISSGEVRRRLRRGDDIAGLVPEEVLPYLASSR